jgi:hypothetical protein
MTHVLIPDHVWSQVLAELARHGPQVERVAYLDGYLIDDTGYPDVTRDRRNAIVTSIVLPRAELTPGNYHVPASAMSQAGQHLRLQRMTRLAQLHTHGNDWVGHSPVDDAYAYSQQPGAISIVLPYHGRRAPQLHDCGVHVRQPSGWKCLADSAIDDYVRIVPTIYDHRDPQCLTRTIQPRIGIFSRLRAWLTRRRPPSPPE